MELVQRARQGDRRALARLITLVENEAPEAVEALQELYLFTGKAQVIGITGPPGSGKSTLTDKLVKELRKEKKKVAVIAVDPTSPFTGGAILGDRIRMSDLNLDEDVYIRSMGTRGSLGGLSAATSAATKVLDACDFDYVFIETVGVGQSEVDIVKAADTTIVVMVPGLGDDIQAIKAGILEIGDFFVVNKADRDGANRVALELRMMLDLNEQKLVWQPPVLMSVANQNQGIAEIVAGIKDHFTYLKESGELAIKRRERLEKELLEIVSKKIYRQIADKVQREGKLKQYLDSLMKKETDPYTLVKVILQDVIKT
ncbi:MAG: methylmalonyl Co-A mutase-associated GTPase MeaB [Clostridia bacterium]|jgi:LAO/AO transport system kinase|nr:methylmalonyl Co-A mutase-associated GTPase MeaB [Clostridia bacterium]MDD4145858.1 methylmalonyl Co-A mutase-associated GTPase MeaB [Clostridia bacterium]MDD4665070.1 methylmalonyl Co-A mutase-associated GTPase MeaB [Clostridia bacterium]